MPVYRNQMISVLIKCNNLNHPTSWLDEGCGRWESFDGPVGVGPVDVETIENADLDTFDPVSVLLDKRSSGEPIHLLAFDSALLSDTFRLGALLLNNEAFSERKELSCWISTIGLNTFGAKNAHT